MAWTLAQSIQEQVDRLGAFAGIAAFLGVALLAVLHFAQAREVKRLRDWAGRAPERARELEERVAELAAATKEAPAEQQPGAAAGPAPPGPAPDDARAAPPAPGREQPVAVPASVAASPAAATALSSVDAPGAPADHDAQPRPDRDAEVATSGQANGQASGPDAPAPVTDTARETGEEATKVHAGPPPSPPAKDQQPPANGQQPPAGPAEEGTPARRQVEREPDTGARRPTARPATAAALRAGNPSATPARRPPPGSARRGGPAMPPRRPRADIEQSPPVRSRAATRIALIAVLAVIGIVGAAVALTALDGDGGADPQVADGGQPGTTATPEPTPTPAATPSRADTTVAVLNGTAINGLAAQLAEQVSQAGYMEGPRGNLAGEQRETSVVFYSDGFDAQGQDVASLLDISEVQPMDEQTRAQAIGDAEVVVIAGHDQAP